MSQDGFLPCDLAIEIQQIKVVVTHERACNTNGDGQVLHIGICNVKVCIMDTLNVNTFLPIPNDKMITVVDAIGSFIM